MLLSKQRIFSRCDDFRAWNFDGDHEFAPKGVGECARQAGAVDLQFDHVGQGPAREQVLDLREQEDFREWNFDGDQNQQRFTHEGEEGISSSTFGVVVAHQDIGQDHANG